MDSVIQRSNNWGLFKMVVCITLQSYPSFIRSIALLSSKLFLLYWNIVFPALAKYYFRLKTSL